MKISPQNYVLESSTILGILIKFEGLVGEDSNGIIAGYY